MQRWKNSTASRVIPIVGLLVSTFLPLIPLPAHAVFTQAYVRLDRMKLSTATGGTVCVKPATVGTESKILVSFPDALTSAPFTVNTTAANWVMTTTDLPAGSTALPGVTSGTTTATSATSPANVVTFPSGDLTVATLYCFNFVGVSTLTTGSSAQTSLAAYVETQTSGSATVDKTSLALTTITDDQIVVTAIVPPTFSFALSGNADAFTLNLDPGNVRSTTGRTVTVTTNAKGGWIAWAKDSRQGLYSASANYTIPTSGTINAAPNTLTNGNEGYVLDVDATFDATGGCTLASDAEYNGPTGSPSVSGGTLSAVFQPIASCVVATTGTANGDIITLTERASISGATPAGSDYTDTITVVGAGNF